MLINPKKLLRRERQLKAVIGMGGKEFKILHKQFDEIYNKIQQNKLRKRAIGGGRQGVIKDTKSKLLFILMYVKVYPTYDLAGALFGVVASRPHEWVNEYLPILEEALGRHCVLPARKSPQLRNSEGFIQGFKRLFLMVQKDLYKGQKIIKTRKKHIQVRRNVIQEKIYIS